MADAAVEASSARTQILTVGTMVWLASELMFFSGLFAAWFALRAHAIKWPPDGVELDLLSVSAGTALLVASSGTMQLAVRAVLRDDRIRFLRWLAVSFVLGAVFLAGQARDWDRLTFSVDTSAYGSAFYLLTGVHGLHVLLGLAAMVLMAGRAADHRFGRHDAPSVEMLSYYWHFVDVVWLGLYATIFLLQ